MFGSAIFPIQFHVSQLFAYALLFESLLGAAAKFCQTTPAGNLSFIGFDSVVDGITQQWFEKLLDTVAEAGLTIALSHISSPEHPVRTYSANHCGLSGLSQPPRS